jgi:hypothetical protein
MLLSWIVKTIPRSPRALFMLVVALGGLVMVFLGLQNLFVPNNNDNAQTVVLAVAGAAIAVPAMAIFYYFQAADDFMRHGLHVDHQSGQQRTYRPNRAKKHN